MPLKWCIEALFATKNTFMSSTGHHKTHRPTLSRTRVDAISDHT